MVNNKYGAASIRLVLLLLLSISLMAACSNSGNEGSKTETPVETDNNKIEEKPTVEQRRYNALHGSSIELDPVWPYYRDRSVESIADEIELAGYKTVHYVVVNENNVNGRLIEAFHERGIAVWMLVFGNGSYSVANFPKGWEEWQMELVKPSEVAGFTFLSLFSEPYTQWKKQKLAEIAKEYPFDGIEIMESFFPEWNGLTTGVYGDIGPNAQAAFQEKYGRSLPNFSDPSAENYYLNNKELYEQWIEFRVEGINSFLNEIINGEGGVREARPDILVGTYSLGVHAGLDQVAKLREYQGLDAAAIVSAVKPDIHFIQTHWPDWQKPEASLPADYMKYYKPFVDQIREQHPDQLIGFQADNGSVTSMIKSTEWQKQLDIEVPKYGYSAWLTYEYHIGGYMYTEKPQPMRAIRSKEGEVIISFNKRIDDVTGEEKSNFTFFADGQEIQVPLSRVIVDGNRAKLLSDSFPDHSFEVLVEGIQDTPERWLYFKDAVPNVVAENSRVTVAAVQKVE